MNPPQQRTTPPQGSRGPILRLLVILVTSLAGEHAVSAVNDDEVRPGLTPGQLARVVDQALSEHWQELGLGAAGPVLDSTFLRRLSLDLRGTIPTRNEVEAFLRSKDSDKRVSKTREILNDPRTAEYRAAIWNNLLLDEASRGPEGAYLYPWLVEAFENKMPFDELVRQLVSASGRNDENGATSFVLAYRNEPEGLAAVTARTFLGLQIQCAQCHDHPYEDWTQDDFNGLAAFFALSRGKQADAAIKPPVYELEDVTLEQHRREQWQRLVKFVRRYKNSEDADQDDRAFIGNIASRLQKRPQQKSPDSPLVQTLVEKLPEDIQERIQTANEEQKRFEVATTLDGETADERRPRREVLAEWMIAPENPYFARTIVNRVFKQLHGYGLMEPVDDLGGAGDVVLPQLLDVLAVQWRRHDYSLDYLYETLARTRAYALGASDADDDSTRRLEERHFAAHPLRPLSGEQVLRALIRATGIEDSPKFQANDTQRKLHERMLDLFQAELDGESFDFDAGIPEALFLMNSKLTNDAISLANNALLQEILHEVRENTGRVRQMFYATLCRPPTRSELGKLARLLKSSPTGHGAAVTDLYWALLNSSEFHTNH